MIPHSNTIKECFYFFPCEISASVFINARNIEFNLPFTVNIPKNFIFGYLCEFNLSMSIGNLYMENHCYFFASEGNSSEWVIYLVITWDYEEILQK